MKKFTIPLLLMLLLASTGIFSQKINPGQVYTAEPDENNLLKPLQANDVGVMSILSPLSGINLNQEMASIRVKNFGTVPQSDIPVSYSVNGGTPVNGIIKGPMEPGATFDYTFQGFVDLADQGQGCSINACTSLENDDLIGNDCVTNIVWNMDPPYCDCNTITEDEYIANVLFGMINNSSGWQGGIADYTDQFTVIASGESEDMTITNGNAWASDFVYVWVDWDQDFDFCTNLALEQYILTNVGGTGEMFTGLITVPDGQANGEYRMRIRMSYSTPPSPGGSATYGEVEEYTIVVFNVTNPGIHVSPVMLSQILNPDQIATKEIMVSNIGENPLDFNITVSNSNNGIFNENQGIYNQSAMIIPAVVFGGELNSFSLYRDPDLSENTGGRSIIRYDNGDHAGAFGIEQGGTYEISAYFPAATMAQYSGQKLNAVEFYFNGTPISCKLKIYGQGTPNSPGTLLHEEPFFAYNSSWSWINLSPPVKITGEDLWIGYEITHAPGVLPSSYDSGPAIGGFGDLIKIDGEWTTLADYGLDNNWNLYGNVGAGAYTPADDVGVESIISPVTGPDLGDEIVKIRVKNFGLSPRENIPVSFSIDGGDTISSVIPGTLVSGATVDFPFPGTSNFWQSGQAYILNSFTALPEDGNSNNDHKTAFVAHLVSPYCNALSMTGDEFISNVLFGSINNSSEWQDSIADFTNQFTTIQAGSSENIIITNGLPYTNDQVFAWVDWDKDFNFNAAGEQFVLTDQNGTGETFTGEIMVPANQPTGNYRMRIRMCYYTEPVPCGGSTYGEVEDYTIKVINNQTIPWLSIEPLSGVINPSDSVEVNVTFNSTGLSIGTYTGSIVFSSNDPMQPFTTIPVSLVVGNCPLPAPLNLLGVEILPNIAYLSWEAPEIPGDLLGYNVYRDNEKINDTIITDLFYEESLVDPQQYLYFVTAVYPECEAASDIISLVITELLENESSEISIFPNPAQQIVNIKSQNTIIQIIILNNLGLVVYSGDFESKSIKINTSALKKGIYFIGVNTSDGLITKKLVIH